MMELEEVWVENDRGDWDRFKQESSRAEVVLSCWATVIFYGFL